MAKWRSLAFWGMACPARLVVRRPTIFRPRGFIRQFLFLRWFDTGFRLIELPPLTGAGLIWTVTSWNAKAGVPRRTPALSHKKTGRSSAIVVVAEIRCRQDSGALDANRLELARIEVQSGEYCRRDLCRLDRGEHRLCIEVRVR